MLLSMLFAVSLTACGRTGGGASEVSSTDPSKGQQPPDIRVAEATQGTSPSQPKGVVEDGEYEVCDVNYAGEPKMGASEKKPTGPHIKLSLWDEIEVRKGGTQAPVGSTIFKHFAKEEPDRSKRKDLKPQETALTTLNCCEGQRLGATMAFEHQKDKDKPKSALHAIIIENLPKGVNPGKCKAEPIIVVQFCYPTYDDGGARGWTCEDKNPHGGDVHAQSMR
jgi:hypothetical protein